MLVALVVLVTAAAPDPAPWQEVARTGGVVVYQSTNKGGRVGYVCRWRTANNEGPAVRSGVVRVDTTEGYWQLEPHGEKTRATYYAFATPGGSIPRELADWGTSMAIGKIFEAIRER